MAKIVPLDSIKTIKHENSRNSLDLLKIENKIPSEYEGFEYTWRVKLTFFWMTYKKLFLFLFFILIILIVVLTSVFIKKGSSFVYFCQHKNDDLASDVSIECLRYLWKGNGCNGEIPDNYNGFWRCSPNGKNMVTCSSKNNEICKCGAGNYLYIVNNIFVCDLNYRGYRPRTGF